MHKKRSSGFLKKRDKDTGLRLGIKGGGCSGLSYILEFTSERDGDTVLDHDEFKVFLDQKVDNIL